MKKHMTAWILSFCLILGLTACGTGSTDTQSGLPASSGTDSAASDQPLTIRLKSEGDDGLPNPFRNTMRGPGMSKMRLLYDSLLERDETGDIPWLAKSWDINDDETVYTFHLQEDAVWHDETPLTADDVAFTFSYYKDHPPVTNSLIADGEYIISGTRVIDDHTVEVSLTHYDNTFLADLGITRILPKHIWENVNDPAAYDGEDAAVGSGPYRLDRYDSSQGSYRYVAFDQYWGLKPAAEAIEWVPVSDATLAFENGEIDLINATADILSRYQDDSQYTVKTAPSYHSYRLMMNMEAVPALQDVNVRQAIAYAVDRQKLVDTVARGSATISSMGYIPTTSPWYNPDIPRYDFDLDKAKELMNGKTYSMKLLTDNSADGTKTAELIKIDLAKIGIDLAVESVETKTRDNSVKTGDYELLLINSGGLGGDPDVLRDVYGKDADTIRGWANNDVFTLLSGQATERDEAARREKINEAQKLIAEDVPMVMLFGAEDNYVYRADHYNRWMSQYNDNKVDHNKLSYLIRE